MSIKKYQVSRPEILITHNLDYFEVAIRLKHSAEFYGILKKPLPAK